MTDEERQELETLEGKDNLTEEEQARLAELQALAGTNDVDDFDAAFDEYTAEDDDKASAGAIDKDKDEKKDKDTDDGSSQGKDTGGDIFQHQDKDAGADPDTSKDQDSGDTNWEAKAKDLEGQLEETLQKMKSWEGRINAANKRAEEAEGKLKAIETQDKGAGDSTLPDEEDEDLKDFLAEFPSLEKPIKKIATKIAGAIVERKLGELAPKIAKIDTVVDTQKNAAKTAHFAAIKDAHEDYSEIFKSGKLTSWIEEQPQYLQRALHAVVKEGEAQDVIDMLDSYKRSTGQVTRTTDTTDVKTKQKKAQGLEAVTKSSGKLPLDRTKKDPNDFDSAWDEALEEEKK